MSWSCTRAAQIWIVDRRGGPVDVAIAGHRHSPSGTAGECPSHALALLKSVIVVVIERRGTVWLGWAKLQHDVPQEKYGVGGVGGVGLQRCRYRFVDG